MIALIRSLPKAIRRNFVPVPDYARAALGRDHPAARSRCWTRSTRQLRRMTGVTVPRDAWEPAQAAGAPAGDLPGRSTTTSKPVAEGKDLPALQRQLRQEVRQVVAGRRTGGGPDRAARVEHRHAAAHHRAGPRRLRGDRVPGAGRRGRHGRGEGLRLRGRAGGRALGRHPPAAAADRAVPGAVPPGAAEQRGEAGAEPQPARRRAGADRRRGGRGHRPADRRRPAGRRGTPTASPRCARRSAPTWSTPWSR